MCECLLSEINVTEGSHVVRQRFSRLLFTSRLQVKRLLYLRKWIEAFVHIPTQWVRSDRFL